MPATCVFVWSFRSGQHTPRICAIYKLGRWPVLFLYVVPMILMDTGSCHKGSELWYSGGQRDGRHRQIKALARYGVEGGPKAGVRLAGQAKPRCAGDDKDHRRLIDLLNRLRLTAHAGR